MSSLFRFKAAWQRFFTFVGASSVNEDHDRAPDITREIRKISRRPIEYGGYSDIYTGIWRSATGDLNVAIKVIRAVPTTAESNEMPRALRRELSVWKRLRHRNIHVLCGVYEGIGPVPALVSPWCQNGDIKSYMQRHVDSPDIELLKLRMLCDIMCGLNFLHSSPIVHGDIKGQNVLISDAGVATLCDFGLSRILAQHSQSVRYTGVRGTSRWMAPEIFLDGERHTYASDMWACGCLVIEVWNNVLPYHTKINDFHLSLAFDAKELPGTSTPYSDPPHCKWRHTSASSLCYRGSVVGRPLDAHGRDLWQRTEAHLRASPSTDLYFLADPELVSDVVRHLSLSSILNPQGYPSAQDPVFQWCLAKLSVGNLHLPAGLHVPTADDNQFFSTFSASREPAILRPLARLVEQARPGCGNNLMIAFATPALSRPFDVDAPVWSVEWFSDGNRIVVGCGDATIHILDVASGGTLLRLVGHTGCVSQIAVSPHGMLLASCSDDHSIRLWDAETGLASGAPMVGHTDRVWSVAFSPDCRHIVSGSRDMTIRIWSTETCTTVLGPLHGHTETVYSVAYSPDGFRIVSGSLDRTVRVWDACTGDPILTFRGHTNWVQSVAYSPDGSRVVSGSGDRSVLIWNATTGQVVGSPLEGHSDSVLSVAYSPKGTRIVSGSNDRMIRIWDAATGASIATVRGHTLGVKSVAFSPDGRRLASASDDGTVRIWDATDDWRRWDI